MAIGAASTGRMYRAGISVDLTGELLDGGCGGFAVEC
jgi:hypothetical protein